MLVPHVDVSGSLGVRNARGLMLRRELPSGHGLLLSDPTGSIHTFFMRFAIDIVFLDDDLRVLRVARAVKPWRMTRERGAKRMLELTAGEAERAGIEAGMRLVLG